MNYAIIVLVAFLLVFSVAQAFQISDLKSSVDSGKLSGTIEKETSQQTRTVSGPAPTMVGGC